MAELSVDLSDWMNDVGETRTDSSQNFGHIDW